MSYVRIVKELKCNQISVPLNYNTSCVRKLVNCFFLFSSYESKAGNQAKKAAESENIQTQSNGRTWKRKILNNINISNAKI